MLIKTATGNSRHGGESHSCPHCNKPLNFKKLPFIITCGGCGENVKGENLIKL